jgi:hypothetical protein
MLNDYVLPMLANIIVFLVTVFFFSKYLDKRGYTSPTMCLTAVICCSVILFLANVLHFPWVNSIAGCGLFFIISVILFKGNLALLLILSVIQITISMACELIIGLFLLLFNEIKLVNIVSQIDVAKARQLETVSLYNMYGVFGALLFAVVVVVLAKKFPRKFKYFGNRDLFLMVFPIFAILMMFFLLHITSGTNISLIENLFMLLLQIGLLSSSVLLFFIYGNIIEDYAFKEENRLLLSQINYYKYQFEQIKDSQAVIGKAQHDIEKHLLALKLDLKNAQPDEAEQKIDGLIGNLHLAEGIANSGNADVDAILNYKANLAQELGIRVACDLLLPYTLNMNTTDLAVILGNALDNAIESCKAVDDPERVIDIAIRYNKPNLQMTFTNPFAGSVKTNAAGELVTTKRDGLHGIGLKSIKETVDKYGGVMDISAENNRFVLKILLFNLTSH